MIEGGHKHFQSSERTVTIVTTNSMEACSTLNAPGLWSGRFTAQKVSVAVFGKGASVVHMVREKNRARVMRSVRYVPFILRELQFFLLHTRCFQYFRDLSFVCRRS